MKNKNFEISGPVEYSAAMILTEYSENYSKIAYFHSIFYSSLNVKIFKENEEFVEAITFCKMQSFIKNHIFGILSPYNTLRV